MKKRNNIYNIVFIIAIFICIGIAIGTNSNNPILWFSVCLYTGIFVTFLINYKILNNRYGIIIGLILLLTLIVPYKLIYKDGGTKEYTALLYKVIVWHSIDFNEENGYKTGTEVHFIPNNFHSIDYYRTPTPPALSIINEKENEIFCNLGSYSWTKKVDGENKSIVSDSIHPIEMTYRESLNVEKGTEIYLDNVELNIIKVEIYNEKQTALIDFDIIYDNIEKTITIPNIETGTYVLVISTKYEQGNAIYSLKVNIN